MKNEVIIQWDQWLIALKNLRDTWDKSFLDLKIAEKGTIKLLMPQRGISNFKHLNSLKWHIV